MAQTTAAVTGAAATVSIYVSSAYTDISGSSQSIEAVTAKVVNGDAYTFTGNYPIVTVGKYEKVEVKVNILYTEVTGEAFLTVQTLFAANTATKVKWLPLGAAAGADQYETMTTGYITAIDYPPADASKAGPVMVSFTVTAPGITYTNNA